MDILNFKIWIWLDKNVGTAPNKSPEVRKIRVWKGEKNTMSMWKGVIEDGIEKINWGQMREAWT